MCLYIPVSETSALKPTLAEHDVPCYKFLNFKEGQLTSYFLKFPYEIGKCYTTEEDFSNIAVGGIYFNVIDHGGFHSFIHSCDCHEDFSTIREENDEVVMVRCHIPKGSYYYQGEDMGGAPNYVSQSIVIDEIINDD